MASSPVEGMAEPPTLHTLLAPSGLAQDFSRVYRVIGVLLVVSGTLSLATVVGDFLRGDAPSVGAVRLLLTTTGASSLLIGGTLLLTRRYQAGPDTFRQINGIFGMSLGLSFIAMSSQAIVRGFADRLDILAWLIAFNLVTGLVMVVLAVLSLWSRRYAAWFRRSWEKRERRRADKLGRRR